MPRSQVRVALIGYICALMFALSAFFDVANTQLGVAILTVLMIAAFYDASQGSLGPIILFSGVTLFVLPLSSLIYVAPGSALTCWFALYIIVGLVLVGTDDVSDDGGRPGRSRGNLMLVVLFLILGIAMWRSEGIGQIAFYVGWAMALLHLERLHASTESKVTRLAGVGIFWMILILYMVFLWDGFGRIIFISLFLAPLFLTLRYGTFKLNMLLFTGAAATLPFIGRVIRFGWSDGLAGLSEDSGASHLTETTYLWLSHDQVLNPGDIQEQWALMFFGWVPRDWWPSKPIGIGSSFVDMYLGRSGASLEHSTATGYFGEHLFYLPTFWWASVALLTLVVIALRWLIRRVSLPYRVPVMAFDVWLITLFWGGMASFGSRVWLSTVPMIVYVLILKVLDRRSGSIGAPPVRPAAAKAF